MGQVTVTVNGRTYRLQCGAGEEQRLIELATYVGARVDGLAAEFGQVGDERLLLMAALLVADELLDARERLAGLESGEAKPRVPPPLPAKAQAAAEG
jgi:cell division protein ZapA